MHTQVTSLAVPEGLHRNPPPSFCENFWIGCCRNNRHKEVRRLLRFYVTNTPCEELGYQTKQTDRAFYPTTTDIRNRVYSAKKALELSKLDQEMLEWKVITNSRHMLRHHTFSDHLFCKNGKYPSLCQALADGACKGDTHFLSASSGAWKLLQVCR